MLKAARAFEGQFLRHMVGEMRKTTVGNPLLPNSMGEKIFKEKLDHEYVDMWVNQGGIGLADMVYKQLKKKYGARRTMFAKQKGQALPIKERQRLRNAGPRIKNNPVDILRSVDARHFVAKKLGRVYHLKTPKPLRRPIGIRSPLSGVVATATGMKGGRQAIVIKHDKGLVTRLVHNGKTRVKEKQVVSTGENIAFLGGVKKKLVSEVFFELRKASNIE